MMMGFKRKQRKQRTTAAAISPWDEFSSYTLLGDDGVGHIATVNSTPEQAAAVMALLHPVSEEEWAEFMAS